MLSDATPAATRAYREAIEALFALALEGPDAARGACEKALRHETVAGLGLRLAERQALLREVARDHEESNGCCPYCGGAPHESEAR
jgi:formate dehydrogenase maturation protein FdhE